MVFASITDENQYKYVFVNILSLEIFKKKYIYYIFTSNKYVINLINDIKLQFKFKYGNIIVKQIPSFFEFFEIKTLKGTNSWITATTMDRLVLPYVTDLDKVIYLDTDAFPVSEKVFNLINSQTSAKGIAAVPNNTNIITHIIDFSKVDFLLSFIETNFTTFNAGVLVLDFKKLKENNLKEFVSSIYEIGGNRTYINDELLLNLFDPTYQDISISYNAKPYIDHTYTNIDIVHFSGANSKPWLSSFECTNNLRKFYYLWQYFYLQIK